MGKANRKKQRRTNTGVTDMATEQTMRRQMKNGEYAPALETLVKIIKQKKIKPEFLYDGAYAYFKLGDYERATEWVNNTLTYAPGDIPARLLLAQICLLEHRIDESLAIFEFVLANGRDKLKSDDLNEIRNSATNLLQQDGEKAREDYPELAALCDIAEHTEPVKSNENRNEEPALEAPKETVPILQALKQKIAAAESGKSAVTEEPAAAGLVEEARHKVQEIHQQSLPMQEQVRLLNVFAGSYYFQSEFAAAKVFLDAALEIGQDDAALRNMALLQHDMGNTEIAVQLASKMQVADFMLLRELRKRSVQ